MLHATAELEDGKKLLIFGLSKLNIERLLEGKPIKTESPTVGYVMIFVGDTEASMMEELKELIGPDTEVRVSDRLKS